MPKHLHPGLQDPELLQQVVPVGAPVAAICHAIWMLVEADAVCDRTLTSWPSLQTDVRNAGGTWVDPENAGGTWVDPEVVTDGSLVTSRKPDDLPAFNAAMLDVLGAVG